jgi:hypothetical protein
MRWFFVVCCVLFVQTSARAQSNEYYYYSPDGVGAHAFYNPQNFIVQGGLGALYEERVDEFPWRDGFVIVNRSLTHPVKAVDAYGANNFFYREFTPHLGPGQNYVPNYLWHLMGGGMRTKLMEEYYAYHGFPQPRIWAWTTMYAMHYLNEAVQAARFQKNSKYTVDPLPDMMFFDWVGGLLFRFDAVNRFMSRTLHQREWSYQAQYNPLTRRLFNNGQLYWLRLELYNPVSLSLLTGEQISSLNLTFEWGDGRQLSAGAGPQAKGFIAGKKGETDTSEIIFNVGMYYSIHDNPFVVLTYEPKTRHKDTLEGHDYHFTGKVILNFYPALATLFDQPVGMTLAYHMDAVFFGVSLGMSPGGLVFSSLPVINDP